MAAAEERMSIYRAARSIKKRDNSLYNALRSIHDDSTFVAEIAALWPDLLLVANLRCGLWYAPRFDASCYFKSTDGHTGNWTFSTARLNLHVAQLAGQRGGCIIVDSTRKGKRFPDSMSKTIPIWTCVLNRAVKSWLQQKINGQQHDILVSHFSCQNASELRVKCADWDCSLHLPLWVSNTEKAAIEERVERWTELFEACGADISSLAFNLRKPLRPLWISQKSLIWLNDVPDYNSWDFTPLVLLSASASDGITQLRRTLGFSWHYISGAGDDEESWSRGLSPDLFWKHAFEIIDSSPDLCNKRVAEIVEKDRIYRSQRGEYSPQVTIKPCKLLATDDSVPGMVHNVRSQFPSVEHPSLVTLASSCNEQSIFWFGSTNLAVSSTLQVSSVSRVDCLLNCDSNSVSFCFTSPDCYLHLPMVTSKFDRFSLSRNLPAAVNFANISLSRGKKLLVCCHNGEDISICVCLAILTSLFDEREVFDGGQSFMNTNITKWELRRRLVFVCKFAINARPSRGNLRQVFGFLNRETSIAS